MLRSSIARLSQTSKHLIQQTRSQSSMVSARPNGLIANSGLELLTWATPNGHKVSILLEELKAVYGKEYAYQAIDISADVQKEPWFTNLGPNGRIPVLIDHDNGGYSLMEGSAILVYIVRNYDPDHKFSFSDSIDASRAEQWIAWQHGGLGPMQGQANHFFRYAPEKIPYAIQRYVGETERLYGVLDAQLHDRDYLVGEGRGKYSIADIANFSWVNYGTWAGVDLAQFPRLYKWWERIEQRPAVVKGTAIPNLANAVNKEIAERIKQDPEFAQTEKKQAELLKKAKAQYNYTYKSP